MGVRLVLLKDINKRLKRKIRVTEGKGFFGNICFLV